jgi:hypothetical protein
MFTEQTSVWVWDSYWWPAYVVLPELGPESDVMLVRFESGVTAPVKASEVRYRVPGAKLQALTPNFTAPPESPNLPAGSLASPGLYVVSHLDPAHDAPHEIVIRTEMILPHCKMCGGVRFRWKCSAPQMIEDSAFFNSEPLDLAARLRSAALEVHKMAQDSRHLIQYSKQFLATWDSARRVFAS